MRVHVNESLNQVYISVSASMASEIPQTRQMGVCARPGPLCHTQFHRPRPQVNLMSIMIVQQYKLRKSNDLTPLCGDKMGFENVVPNGQQDQEDIDDLAGENDAMDDKVTGRLNVRAPDVQSNPVEASGTPPFP